MLKLQPPPEKSHPLFPCNPPLKIEVLSAPPLFENLIGGSTPPPHTHTEGGVHTMMLHFAKEDLNLKRTLVEQLEKSDADFNENIAEVSQAMEVIGNVMQQCVGILGNISQTSNP